MAAAGGKETGLRAFSGASALVTGGASGIGAEAATLDVRDATAVDALVAEVFARHARLDYLFNNAGIAVGGEVRCPTQTSSFQSDRRILAGRMSATLST
jgi:NAD(P)-dependent dehydrogenase (short-subunit alcohol dehydrogenase family)